jgi:folate-binding protein YgfZ
MSDATTDYGLLRNSAGLMGGLSGIVWVRGPDAVTFLDGLLSQNVAGLEAGSAGPSLLLTPRGKLRAPLYLLRGPDRVGIVTDASQTDAVGQDLNRFKIRVDVAIAFEPRPVWDIWGPHAAKSLNDVPEPGRWHDDGDQLVAPFPLQRSDLPRFIVAGTRPPVPEVSGPALTAVRIESGEPVMGVDLDEKTIPQEAGDISAAVDFTKGCYLGQELVARIDARGHVNRRLMGLVFVDDALPPAGSEIRHNDETVGHLTSIAWSEGLRAPVGLGLLRVEVGAGEEISAAGVSGEVAALPLR